MRRVFLRLAGYHIFKLATVGPLVAVGFGMVRGLSIHRIKSGALQGFYGSIGFAYILDGDVS